MTYDFFDVRVTARSRLTPSAVRLTFAGPQLGAFASGGRDQRCKLFFPAPGQSTAIVPRTPDWYPGWRAMDPAVRAVMRTYTVAAHRPDEFDVDFALHPGGGPANRWAARAQAGDRLLVLGPTVTDNGGVDFLPPDGTDWVLLAGDETAVPALAAIRAHVGDSLPVHTFVAAAPARCAPGVVHCPAGLLGPVRAAVLPAGTPYAFIAGESGEIRALRRHLVHERGFDRRRVKFTGYWRRGASEDDLIKEAAVPEGD
ncbi:siderophore-interacting protein [Dactylosporangium vinaceum]|uniref:Siderophore-interacting protein n=1 Tax=Dactylosporangium vinaceum TaxID=53362 RepID=A0ABV5MG75_9ACTN|nr:siderophore-interacting protein [Dactylosporangium vinaceum]UAB98990.1 siderophore-interacting protein [Dactylosporangium vinaceum]